MTTTPRVSVIVPHYNDLARLELLLDALDRQHPVDGGFEVIVADNASTVGEAAVRAVTDGRARLTIVREKGAGPARNGGVAIAAGDVLAFTDSDCLPEAAWLVEGLAALEAYDIVGGAMTVLVRDAEAMTPVEAFESVYAFDNEVYVKRDGFTVTANLFCARSTFHRVGDFTTSPISEDIEWCNRARGMGLSLGYAPKSIVGHPARRTWDELVGKSRRISTEIFGLTRTRPRGRLIWLARTLALPLSAVAHTPKALLSPAVPKLSSRLATIGVLYRIRLWRCVHGLTLLAGHA
jgi:glycosyltransferase involved in cell wall biosynthesis